MKYFVYLDNDIIDSIIAQTYKGLITDFSYGETNSNSSEVQNHDESSIDSEVGADLLSILTSKIATHKSNSTGNIKEISLSDNKVVNKILHDASFEIAMKAIMPDIIDDNNSSCNEKLNYGKYVYLKRVFSVIDFDELDILVGEDSLISINKQINNISLDKAIEVGLSSFSVEGQQVAAKRMEAAKNEQNKKVDQQLEYLSSFVRFVKKVMPYDRLLVSYDGYLIPLEDKYFRANTKSFNMKYGGEMRCIGLITNIVGEDAQNNEDYLFSKIQDSINNSLVKILPTREKNLYVVHPIAVYYE